MDWEDTKENFVPVKQGHSAAALSTPLSVAKRSRELEEAKRTFLDNIKTAEDPLAAWQKYIKWTQEQFATQGTKAELQQVLEAATKALSGTKRYNDDVRFLRIFVQYADCLPDPSDVFLYLENHGIGRDHALLYEAYATYLELKGNFQQAGLVYQEGINRLAKPLERLKQKHAGFQQRMEKRVQRHTSEAQLGMDTAAADSNSRATLAPVLAPLGPPQLDENGNPIRPSRQQGHERHARLPPQAGSVAAGIRPAAGSTARPSLFGGSSSSAMVPPAAGGLFGMAQTTSGQHSVPAPIPIATTAATVNGARYFDVLVDDEFGPSGRGALPTAFPAGQNLHGHLPGYKTGRKENNTDAGQWGGQKLKQQAVYTAPTALKLDVYEDEDLAEQDDAAVAPQQQQQASLRQQLDSDGVRRVPPPAANNKAPGHSVASKTPQTTGPEQLAGLQQPTAVPAASNSASSSSASSNSNSITASSAPAAAVATAVPQGYDAALLVAADGSELSFEEVRAIGWRAKRAQQLQEEEQRKRIKLQQQEEQRNRIKVQQQEEEQRKHIKQQQEEQRKHVKLQQEEEQRKHVKLQQEEQRKHIKQQQQEEQRKHIKQQQEEEQRKRFKLQQEEEQRKHVMLQQEEEQRQHIKLQQEEEQRKHVKLQHEEEHRKHIKLQQEEEQLKHIKLQQEEKQRKRMKLQQAEEQQRQDLLAQQQREEQQRLEQLQQQQRERQELEKERRQLALQRQEQEQQKQQLEVERRQLEQQKQEQQQRERQRVKEQQMLLAQQRQQQQPAGYTAAEPTVTVNTRAALESMNFMFSQDLPTMTLSRNAMASAAAAGHGYAEAGMKAPRPMGGVGDEPTVTVTTRAALDAMNGMFGCDDDTTTMHGFGGPRGGMDRSVRAPAAEPTVTINTRQAFDYMNDMFGDKTGQTMTGRQTARGVPKGGHSRLSVAAPGTGWQLHEDTELLQNTKSVAGNRQAGIPAAGNAAGGQACWELREDTECVGTASRQGSNPGMGLDVCEDTEFLTRPVAGAGAVGQFTAYEDTDYLSVPLANATTGLNRLSLANRSSGFGSSGGPQDGLGVGLHEDTDLLTGNPGAAGSFARSVGAGNRAPAAGPRNSRDPGAWGIELHEDTELLTGNAAAASNRGPGQAGRLGGNRHAAAGPRLGLHEDTELLTGHAAASARDIYRQGSGSSRVPAAASASREAENAAMGLQLHEDTELLTGQAAAPAATAAFNRAHSNNSRDTTASAHSIDPEIMPAGAMVLGLHEDTELLSGSHSAAQGSSFSRNRTKIGMHEEASDTTTGLLRIKENLPAAAVPRGPRAPFGSAAATAGGAVGTRCSRLGYSSSPGSPVGHCGPAWGTTTPGKPPMGSTTPSRYGASTSATPNRGPNTPGTPWARPMDDFEVMESPAVREAMAGRPALQMSPAASQPSPGLGHLENLPRDENAGAHIKPRDVHDRSSRAAALQPLSKSRAELLGVEIEPMQEIGDSDNECHECSLSAAGPQAIRAAGKPSALRSLTFQG